MEDVLLTSVQMEQLRSAAPVAPLQRRINFEELLQHITPAHDLQLVIEKVRRIDEVGAIRLSFPSDVQFEEVKRSLLILCALTGEAVQVEQEIDDFWYSLGVDATASPIAANGVGANPLHVDMLTFSRFPRAMAILCERPDPQGGGATMLSRHSDIRSILTQEEENILRLPIYSYWKDEGLINVGEHMDNFAILPTVEGGRFRFTSKFARRFEQHPPAYFDQRTADMATEAVEKISTSLADHSIKLNLKPYQAVLYSQLQYCHGRTSLGEGQESVPQEQRRQLWRMYFNSFSISQ